jgi:hypothetical protein
MKIAFDITCGYLEDVNFSRVENTTSEAWNVTAPAFAPYYAIIYPTRASFLVTNVEGSRF